MIDRYLLRYFLAVVDEGNFTRAALRCRVSQPTLSIGIAKLETLLDRQLLHRTNRRVALTAAGTRFAVHARRIEAEFAEAERGTREDAPGALVRLGIVSTIPSAWVEQAFVAARPGAAGERIELVEGRARDLRLLLERGRVDIVLAPVGDDPHRCTILFEEGYALALPSAHSLAGRDVVAAEEVAHETMIVRRHCEALSDVSRHFTARGIRPFMAARTASDDRAIAYVRAGLGITVMPQCFAGPGMAMPALSGFGVRRAIGFLAGGASTARLDASVSLDRFATALRQLQSRQGARPPPI